MNESREAPGERDYSCEIIGLATLFLLSALSHFWYILIIFCLALLSRELVSLACEYFVSSLPLAPWHSWKNSRLKTMDANAVQMRRQVFKPSKIS